MTVKSEREVVQSCPTLSDPMDGSPPGSSIHGIFQARVLEWVPLPEVYGVSKSQTRFKWLSTVYHREDIVESVSGDLYPSLPGISPSLLTS